MCITSLEIEDMIESDHLLIVLAVNVSQNIALAVDQSNTVQDNRQAWLTEEIIWQEDKEQTFKKQLNSDKIQTLEAAKAKLEHDGALGDFVECLISASQCMVRKCHMNKYTKGAAWFDTECREAKRESKDKLRKFRKTRKQEDRKDYADSNKSYRRLTRIKKKKKEFKRNKAAFLATNLKNASVFWPVSYTHLTLPTIVGV